MRKKRKGPEATSPERDAELREQHARTQRMLADRIAYHQARVAERKRASGERPSVA
jgi:hypothetical protein